MEPITILAGAAIAYLLFKSSPKKEEGGADYTGNEDGNGDPGTNLPGQKIVLNTKLPTTQRTLPGTVNPNPLEIPTPTTEGNGRVIFEQSPGVYVDLSMSVKYKLKIASIGDTLWNCDMAVTITNDSKTQARQFRNWCCSFSLFGYQVDKWFPGNRDSIRLAPGESVTLHSTWQDKCLWSNIRIPKDVRSAILKKLGKSSLTKINYPATLNTSDALCVVSTWMEVVSPYAPGTTNKVMMTAPQTGELVLPARVKIFNARGTNAKNWKDYVEEVDDVDVPDFVEQAREADIEGKKLSSLSRGGLYV